MNNQKTQAWLLRIIGTIEILAFISVVMPRSWMEASHAWLNMGDMPEGPVLIFMIRQASYAYGMHGILLWLMATDVERFKPLVTFTGFSFLLAGPVFFLIDYTSGMPLWWTIGDALACLFFGVALMLLNRRDPVAT